LSHSRASAHPRPARAVALLAVAAVLAAVFTTLLTPGLAAHAAAYRYWGYYHLADGKWAFAQTGPDKSTPADGAVEGWRFAIGDESVTRMPRATPSFTDICGATPAVAGKKRVGLVLDFGREADADNGAKPPAPAARCAVVDTKATGAEVLAAAASVRAGSGGLVCGIDGYPATGCGGEVKVVPPAAKAADTPVTIAAAKKADAPADAPAGSGTSPLTWVGLAVVVLAVAAVGILALRRRGQG